ncbi:MAG: SagB/ThcOx family dehydrogenase [Elusimicrobiota bacterium]
MRYSYISLIACVIYIFLHTVISAGDRNAVELPDVTLGKDNNVSISIERMHSVRDFADKPLELKDVSQLIWAAGGTKIDAVTGASRSYPSAGACYPLEFHLVAGNIKGLSPGIYRYDNKHHVLRKTVDGDMRKKLAEQAYGQKMFRTAPCCIVITSVNSRTTSRYPDRGSAYIYIDAGHSGQNIYLTAAASGYATVAVGAFNDSGISTLLKLPRTETPVILYPLGYPE